MHHEDIKAAIRKRGVTPAQLAEHLDVAPGTVTNVIKGGTKSARIANAIAAITELSLEQLWPGKYSAQPVVTVAQLLKGANARPVAKQVRRAA